MTEKTRCVLVTCLQPEQTPAEVGIEDNESIDAMVEQTGGWW